MEHLDLAGILTTPPQWNVPAFEQQDAIYLSSSRQMLEPIMEETSEDEEHALNSWNQYEQSTQRKEEGASFWSSAESETGSVIRIEINKDTDSISERDYLCPAKRARRCEELIQPNSLEEEVILRRPLYGETKNNSLERFLAYESASRDSWGTGSQQRNSTGSRRFDEFYSDSDSLSYNSLSRSSSLIQFESLERQLMLQEQHTSMNSLGNSSPSLLSFDAQTGEESNSKTNISVSSNSSNNSRRGSQSSLLKRYESTDGRLHQTYYDLDKLNFDEMNTIRAAHSKFLVNNTELRSDSESSESTSSSSESSCRPNSVLSPVDSSDNDGLKIKPHTAIVFQRRGSKNSAENLSEDSGYCEPTNWFNLRRSKSQNLLKSSEKFCEEIEQEGLIQETEATTNPDKHSRNKTTKFYKILKIGDFESLPTATVFTKDFFIDNNKKSNSASIQPTAFIELSTLPEAIDYGRETTTGEKMLPPFYKNSSDERVITPNIHDNNDEKEQNENHADEEHERSLTHSPSPASSETTSAVSPTSSRTSTDSSVTTCASAASFTWLRPPTRGAHDIETFTENSMPDIRDEKTSTTTEETELFNIFCSGESKINRNGRHNRHNQLLNICDLLEVLRTGSGNVLPNTTTNTLHNISDFNAKKQETYCSNICVTEKAENLMWCHGNKFSSVPSKLNELGNKTYENSFFNSVEEQGREKQHSEAKSIQRSASWSFSFNSKSFQCKEEDGAARGYMNASYYNLSEIKDFDIIDSFKMSDRKRTSLSENEIICKSNFLLNEVSKHYDRSASILTDKPIDCFADALQRPSVPLRNRKETKASQNEMEYEAIQHVQLVLRKPSARQHHKAGNAEKTLSLKQDMTIPGLDAPRKTFDQDPTNLKTSYAQSLERCNFDPKELSNHDLSTTTHRSLTKRRFHNQTNNKAISKKKHLVSSTPNLNAYDYNQDIVEDDLYVSSAHTSMHQLPQNTTAKPLGILLPVGSRNSFNKEVSFCPVVSKYSWQEQSSAESNEPPALRSVNVEIEDDSEDELLDNADATVIYNTKENENIAMRLKEEIDKLEIEESMSKKERKSKSTATLPDNSHDQEQEHTQRAISNTVNNENESENEMEVKHVSTTSVVSTTRNITTAVSSQQNVNNASLTKSAEDSISTVENKQTLVKPTVILARPLSIQLPILTEPPINRAHHILYASQQMLDNLDKREEQEKDCSKFSKNLKKMDYPISKDIVTNTASSVYNNNNDIMKSKFKADEKHPSSKGFLARFANGFRFSLRRNKKKQLHQQQNTENLTPSSAVNNSTHFANKSPDFIYIPLKGPLPPKNNVSYPNGVNGNDCQPENGNAAKHKIGAKSMNAKEDEQKVTGKPPLPYKQTQKLQSAQSTQQQQQQQHHHQQHQQQQQQPIPASMIVGASRFYTDNYPDHLTSSTNEFLDTERSYYDNNNKQFTTILPMTSSEAATAVVVENFDSDNTANATMAGVNIQNLPTEFSSPSRASVSQKTQMFNDLATKSNHLPLHSTPHQHFPDNNLSSSSKIGLIETNLDTHETVITGKTRSLINIGPQQQKLHLHSTTSGSGANSVGVKRINELTARRRMHLNDDEIDDNNYYNDNDDDEVVVRPDGTVIVVKNNGANTNAGGATHQIATVRRPHKSMEFLLDKENQKNVLPPENELQKSHDHNPAALSEHQLRIQASLQRLNIPDWFRQYSQNQSRSPESAANTSSYRPGNFTRKRAQDSGRWAGLNSKTTSLSSLGSQRSDRSPLLLSPSAHSHHGGQTTLHTHNIQNANVSAGSGGAGTFSRWSTSHLNSSQISPSVSQRGSFSRGGPINSSFMSVSSGHSAIRNSMRQPYMGWRSQEKLSQRTAHERLASSLLAQQQRTSPSTRTTILTNVNNGSGNNKLPPLVTPEIQTSIKEVTSAIVHYVNDQTNQQRSRSTSPNSRKCWLESSFVGTRPLDSPQTPIIENTTFTTAVAAAAAASLLTTTNIATATATNNNNNNFHTANHNQYNLNTRQDLPVNLLGNEAVLTRMNNGGALNNGTTTYSSVSSASGTNLIHNIGTGYTSLPAAPERSLSSASLEDVLTSLLGLSTTTTYTTTASVTSGVTLATDATATYARSSTGDAIASEATLAANNLKHMPQNIQQKTQPIHSEYEQQKENIQQQNQLQVLSKEEQQRLRRRSEGDAPTQKSKQLQHQNQKLQQYAANANVKTAYASDSLTTLTHSSASSQPATNNINVVAGTGTGSSVCLAPRRVSLGDSSESNNKTISAASGELQIKCRNTKCDRSATPADAKKYYKSCHNCTYLYCSRECRRAHWEKHRKACLHSRASNLCRQVLATCKDDLDSQRHLSLMARKGYLSQGRGVVRILFRSAEAAEGFIKHGFQCLGEASYVRWPDLMPAEMGLELYSELLRFSTEYKPESKMLIYVAICVVSEAPGMGQAPVRWERQLVSRCAKLKLCKSVLAELDQPAHPTSGILQQQQQQLSQPITMITVPEPTTEVLILTFNPQLRTSSTQRELVFSNILNILSRRGVVLRRHYPEIFQRLQSFAEGQTEKFNPVTLHPRNSQTGQNFVCIIMPVHSESEIIKLPSAADGGNRVTTIDVGSQAALAQLDDDELLMRTTS